MSNAPQVHVLLYCHNVSGLGHIVRSNQIAAALVDAGGRATIVTGCAALESVPIDPRVSVVPIPPVRRASLMRFEATEAGLVDVDIMRARAARILDQARAARAAVILADLLPLGLRGELLPTLVAARAEGWSTSFVWGLPYVDVGIAGARLPANPRILAAFRMYESVIAYEDPSVQDLFEGVPAWALPPRRVSVGVVASHAPVRAARSDGLVVVTCGGGASAASLCRDVIAARRLLSTDQRISLRLAAGPLADLALIQSIASEARDAEVVGASTLSEAVPDAHVVVSRAGYNSTAQLLRTDFPIVFVPYAGGSGDQVLRARRLDQVPGVEIVEEGSDCAVRLAAALDRALRGPPTIARAVSNQSGAVAAARWLLDAPARAAAL